MRVLRTPRRFLAVAVLGAAVAVIPLAIAGAGTDPGTEDHTSSVRANVRDVNGNFLGTVTITSLSGRLGISGRLSGIAPGFHGFHIHAVGLCDPRAVDPVTGLPNPFITAGGHLNPGGSSHGDHAGDLPSLLVMDNGRAAAAFETDQVTLSQIFDADGGAFIVHVGRDNFANIPTRYSAGGVPGPDAATLATGDAGARFACGVIVRS